MEPIARIQQHIRSTADLSVLLGTCFEVGHLALVQVAFESVPDWMTFHEVRSAIGSAGFQLAVDVDPRGRRRPT